MEIRTPPILQDGEPERIFLTHDEVLFYANDGKKTHWSLPNEQPLRPKTMGRCLMVSAFVSPECGLLALNDRERVDNEALPESERVPVDSTKIVRIGAKLDGCWTN